MPQEPEEEAEVEEEVVVVHQCYNQVECSARLEWMGCNQDAWLSERRASASGTLLEH